MTNFFEHVSAKCKALSAKKEIEIVDNQIAKLQAKKQEITGKADVRKETSANVNLSKVNEFYNIHLKDELTFNASFSLHDMKELTSFMRLNQYDEILCHVTENLIIDVQAEKLNVTETVKAFLRRVNKKNAKDLSEKEASFLTNHLSILYAIKHKVKDVNEKHDFSSKKKDMTLMQYSKYRYTCIKDIYV